MPLRQLHIHNLSILQAGILPIVVRVGKHFLHILTLSTKPVMPKTLFWKWFSSAWYCLRRRKTLALLPGPVPATAIRRPAGSHR